jgi:hypothetical protein
MVVPETEAGSSIAVGVARLSFAGGPAKRAAVAVAGIKNRARAQMSVACRLTVSLLAGGLNDRRASAQRRRDTGVTVLRQLYKRGSGLLAPA